MIIATDIPLSERQLKRVCKRSSRTFKNRFLHGNGSGDIVIAFTTSNKINHYEEKDIFQIKVLNGNKIDEVFIAAAESIDASILNSLICAETTVGKDGHIRHSLKEFIEDIMILEQ